MYNTLGICYGPVPFSPLTALSQAATGPASMICSLRHCRVVYSLAAYDLRTAGVLRVTGGGCRGRPDRLHPACCHSLTRPGVGVQIRLATGVSSFNQEIILRRNCIRFS